MKKPRKPRLTDEERATSELRRKAYRARWNALQRCTNPLHKDFKHYGARGITMDPELAASTDRFIAAVGLPPTLDHSLDRRDNDGPYSRHNCRWILRAEQTRNTRKSIHVMRDGEPMIASEAELLNGWRRGIISGILQKVRKMGAEPDATT